MSLHASPLNDSNKQMHWHIQGAGSLGCLWAARFAAAGQSVTLILRNTDTLARYRHNGTVRISTADSTETTVYPIPAELPSSTEPISHLLLACKAYDAAAAIQQVAQRLNKDSRVVLLQNGLGSQQAVQALLPNTPCIAASSTEGAFLAQPFHSVFAGRGEIWLGSLNNNPEPQALIENLQGAQIHCRWTSQISTTLWRKLAINCAINPLTVIHDCSNGNLTEHAAVINTLCNELETLLHAAQQSVAAHNLNEQVWQVIQRTAANSSSMRQDVHNKRRTEISYMTGFACAQSIALECPTPALHALHAQLQAALSMRGLPIS